MLGVSDTSIGIVSSLMIHVGVAVACFGSLGDGTGLGNGAVEVAIHGPDELRQDVEPVDTKGTPERPSTALNGATKASPALQPPVDESAPSSPQEAPKKRPDTRDSVLEESPKTKQLQGGGGILGQLFSPPVAINVPKPEYPTVARRRGVEGVVVVRIRVDENGRLSDASVVTSSGSKDLDESALGSIREATFRPALRAGIPVAADKKISIRFSLTE
jgi:protein TonB